MKNKLESPALKLLLTLFLTFCIRVLIADHVIKYTVSMPEPHTHLLEVEMMVSNINQDYVDLKLPAWTPGSYVIRDYAQFLESFKAYDNDGNSLKFEKLNKNTWRLFAKNKSEVKASYKIYSFKRSVHHNFLDDEHAFITGANTFMYIEGMINLPLEIEIKPYEKFKKISTGLSSLPNDNWTFKANNYDQLVDSPFEIGNHEILEFEAANLPHEIAIYGYGNHDNEKLVNDFTKIIESCTNIFGENPNVKYTFIIHNENSSGNALEHMNSTVIDTYRWGYKDQGSYKGFLGTVAHEYFHLWNIKRLRPAALGPFNYEKENHSKSLWVVEGFTNYYGAKILFYSGVDDVNDFLGDDNVSGLASGIYYSEMQPGIRVQSTSDASFDAWIKHYKRNENSHNSTISYYNKGTLLALILDLEILNHSNGKRNLDDFMRYMYEEFYKNLNRGYSDDDLKKGLERFTGHKLDKFYEDYIDGVKTIDYEKYLSNAGLKFSNKFKPENEVELGLWTRFEEGRLTVRGLDKGTSCYDSGLNAFDEIIAVNGFRVKSKDLSRFYKAVPGEKVDFLISRNGQIRNISVVLTQRKFYYRPFIKIETPSKKQNLVYNRWLKVSKKSQSK